MSATILSDSKSILAKLLAGENLNVVHRRISTAMIDLKTRTLYCPIWEDMSGELYDLLMGHEVSHALHTPTEGWHDSIVTGKDAKGKDIVDKKFKGVLNVVEDARIEKLIKRKYPGIMKSFIAGYKILFARDFFGVKKLRDDYSSLNIIDRVNLYAKCGSFLVVPFADHEKDIVREVEDAETWEQVVDIAKRLQQMAKEEQESKMNDLDDLTEELMKQFEDGIPEEEQELDLSDDDQIEDDQTESEDEESGEDAPKSKVEESDAGEDEESPNEEESDTGESTGEEDDSESEETDGEGDASGDSEEEDDSEEEGEGAGEEGDEPAEDDEESTEEPLGGSQEGGTDGTENDPESVTDKAFRERERELICDALEIYQYNLPKPLLDRIIVPNKVFLENFYNHIETAKRQYHNDPIVETCSLRFNQNNNRYINLLVKEFEMRKNARQYARTQTARTGELDMSKLHKYKYSNDIFRKINVVEKGKSHGMIMYVDMSGSMDSMFGPTMEQTLILVAFCRKVGIPFDVYGFSDKKEYLNAMYRKGKLSRDFLSAEKFQRTGLDKYVMEEQGFHLIHFISSQFGGNHYRRAFDAMATVAMNWKNRLYARTFLNWDDMGFDLGGTPFTQAIMASRPMIEKFKQDNGVDITNVIYLTDGDGTGCFKFTDIKASPYNPETGKPRFEQVVYMIDPKTKQRVELSHTGNDSIQHQTAMTQFVRKVTGCKHIGFYIAESSILKYRVAALSGAEKASVNDKFFRENGYFSAPHIGYDMYYYVAAPKSNVQDKDYTVNENDTVGKIAKTFTDAQESKRRHRVLVSTFAKDIAA